jgi:hypothetical protein
VDASEEPGLRELAEIAPYGVGGDGELGAQVGRDDLAVTLQPLEDEIASLFAEHGAHSSRNVQRQAAYGKSAKG